MKYQVDLIVNNEISPVTFELYDNRINLLFKEKKKEIWFNNIMSLSYNGPNLNLVLTGDQNIIIRTERSQALYEYISLLKYQGEACMVTFLSQWQLFFRKYIICAIIVCILFIQRIVTFGFIQFAALLVFSLVPAYIVFVLTHLKNNVFGICPHCHEKVYLNDNTGGMKLSILPGITRVLRCPKCKNELGLKYDYLFKLDSYTEQFFIQQQKPTNQTNTVITSNDVKLDELNKLKQLLDSNVITQADYDKKKEEILNSLKY